MTPSDAYYHLWIVAQLCGIGMPGLAIIGIVLWMTLFSGMLSVYQLLMRRVY